MKYTAAHWGAYRFDGRGGLLPLEDDPSPSRVGQGWVSAARDRNSRILAPAVRRGWLEGDSGAGRCRDGFIEVSWEKAVELAAGEIARVSAEHGNGAIFGGSYGWSSAGRFHHAQSQMRRFLNLAGGFVSSRETYSHAAAEVLFPHVLGLSNRQFQDQLTSMALVEAHCDVMLCFGGLSGRTAQITSSGTTRHEVEGWIARLAKNGARIVNVSPQQSDVVDADAEWVAIRPGTDTTLLLALTFEIVKAGEENTDFLARCTSGWETYRAYLLGETDGVAKSADWASSLCDIPAAKIREIARLLTTRRSMVSMVWGMQRSDHGEQPIWAGIALACAIGQIGRPGTGFAFGYGSVTACGRPSRLIGWPSLPQGRNPISDFIPVARISDMLLHPGDCYAYNGETRAYPHIRLVYWTGGNPFHHHQDLNRLERAWRRPETVVVNDHSWTATARRADIVLPATTPLERADIMINRRDPSLIYMSPLFEPMGAARDDYAIFKLLSRALGFEDRFTEGRDAGDWIHWLWDRSCEVAKANGFELPDFDAFVAQGRFDVPDAEEHRIALKDFVADPQACRLGTESGRITLHNETIAAMGLDDCPGHPVWLAPAECLFDAGDDELHLISGQPDVRLHGQNDRGSESLASKINGREPAFMHPDAARARGLAEGDVIRLFNARGACLAGLRLDAGLRPDCIALATGAWFDPQTIDGETIEVHGNPNVLTIDKGTSGLAQGNIAHTALVRAEKWDKALPELSIDKPPVIERLD